MNRSAVFGRKIVYLVVLIVMLVPLFLLGQPDGGEGDSRGELASMRIDYNIAESDLGEINPASETAKLASLGLRGIAATMLWQKSHEYAVRHEWDRLKASLNQIALLQPHFDKVWEHQAWNLAYNVSSQFDDYRQRYEMVREGTEFLQRGVRQNRRAPRLVWYTGWFYGQKIGKSDEKTQFRRLFADDNLQHDALRDEGITVEEAHGPLNKPDNWLVGRLWFNRGYELVDGGIEIRRQTPLNFYESGPKWMFEHATVIEKEGVLDDRAQIAWQKAHTDWVGNEESGIIGLGNRPIPTTAYFKIQLGALYRLIEEQTEKKNQIIQLAGEEFVRAKQEKIDELDADLKAVWDTPIELRSEEDRKVIQIIEGRVQPDTNTLVAACPPETQLEAKRLLGEINDLDERIRKTNGYRNQINYQYWETLALAEKERRTVEAREKIYLAEKANADAELDEAIRLYESAFKDWAAIFDDYPILVIDDSAEDLFQSIQRYFIAIDTQELPDDFSLKTFVEMMGVEGRVSPEAYAMVREEQAAKAAERQRELDEQERKLREEAEKKRAEAKITKEDETSEDEPAKEETESAETNPTEEQPTEKEAEMKEPAKEEPAKEKPAKEEPAEPDATEEDKS